MARARHRELSVPVVLKTLLETEQSLESFSRLLNEARLMARIPSSARRARRGRGRARGSLAIPAIGTGVARVVPETAANALARALHEHVLLGGTRIRDVRFVLFDKVT